MNTNNNTTSVESISPSAIPATRTIVLDDNKSYSNYNEAFDYLNINRCIHEKLFIKYLDDYEAYNVPLITGKNFIHLARKTAGNYGATENERGFKFHISLANFEDNVAKGWNIIKAHLIIHEVLLSKIIFINALHLMTKSRNQCGKEITIYAYRENRPSQAWQKLIEDVTHDLIKNQIKPGPLPPSDTEISGSNFFSYRNDKSREEFSSKREEVQQDFFPDYESVYEDSSYNS